MSEPSIEVAASETPKVETAKVEAPKVEAPKVEAVKAEASAQAAQPEAAPEKISPTPGKVIVMSRGDRAWADTTSMPSPRRPGTKACSASAGSRRSQPWWRWRL